jgi:heme A synthase
MKNWGEIIRMLHIFSLITVVATWILLLIGGIVNPMGASLACPDWYFIPTCNGELLPAMVDGVLYEHGHRLWASAVGLLTLVQCGWIFAKGKETRDLRFSAILSVVLVAVQGTLGGVTVLLGLNALLSSLHLLTAMLFLCVLIFISFKLIAPKIEFKMKGPDSLATIAFVLILVQILLGGAVRHLGAGLACGDDWMSCGPQFWPASHLAQLHMTHRLFGYFVAAIVVVSNLRSASWAGVIAYVPTGLLVVQVALGLLTVATVRSVPVVVAHTAIGALVLAAQFLIVLKASSRQNQRLSAQR